VGDAALSKESGYRIRCLNFADARLAPMRLAIVHEKL
jgi:hypothetical protein